MDEKILDDIDFQMKDLNLKMKILNLRIKEQNNTSYMYLPSSYLQKFRESHSPGPLIKFSLAAQQCLVEPLDLLPEIYADLCDTACYRQYKKRLLDAENSRQKKKKAKDKYIQCINDC